MLPLCARSIQRSILPSTLPFRTARGIASNVNTVDASEIELFSRLSSQWWDERGEFAMLHQMNPVRMEFIRQKLQEVQLEGGTSSASFSTTPLEGLDVLDVGCGGGLLSEVRDRKATSFEKILTDPSESHQTRC
jgi:polyprenyldihydroxybenzoate methyltransferase/3-demethylubiquinol 3-O-methyltransferase